MIMLKKLHSRSEIELIAAEKLLTHASLNGLVKYPADKLREALEDILFCEFHDILPGSGIPEVEEHAIQKLYHALEILSRIKSKAFFSLLSGHESAHQGEFPLFVYNSFPFEVEKIICCEFQPPEPNFNKDLFLLPELYDQENNKISYQLEKESCNIQTDQRKRIVFKARLRASSMNRFSCYLKKVSVLEKPVLESKVPLSFINNTRKLIINQETGLIDSYCINDKEFLNDGSFKLMVMNDYADPWGMKVNSFRNIAGEFSIMTNSESAIFSGIKEKDLPPVRIIEDGDIRTIIESVFKYKQSTACLRYIVPKEGNEIGIDLRIYMMEKDKMLKLSVPTTLFESLCYGQVAYGTQKFDRQEEELIAHKWLCLTERNEKNAFSIINDGCYGFDYCNGELRISLLRTPAYAGHPVDDVTPIVMQNRFEQRIDQGERKFSFWMNAGEKDERLNNVENESVIKNENLMAICCYPGGVGKKIKQLIIISNDIIRLSTIKMAEKEYWLIIRLFNPTGSAQKTQIHFPIYELEYKTRLDPGEIKSLGLDIKSMKIFEVDLLEKKLVNNN